MDDDRFQPAPGPGSVVGPTAPIHPVHPAMPGVPGWAAPVPGPGAVAERPNRVVAAAILAIPGTLLCLVGSVPQLPNLWYGPILSLGFLTAAALLARGAVEALRGTGRRFLLIAPLVLAGFTVLSALVETLQVGEVSFFFGATAVYYVPIWLVATLPSALLVLGGSSRAFFAARAKPAQA